MFLSRLRVNPLSRQARKMITDIYQLHGMVMSGFKPYTTGPRVLFRVEPELKNNLMTILVQSPVAPEWGRLEELGRGLISFEFRPYEPKIGNGVCLRFRLRGNPTVKREGKRYGLIRDEALEGWMARKTEKMGVRLLSLSVRDEGYIHGFKGKSKISLKTALFDGQFQVLDSEGLMQTLAQGLGPAKGFGCGLLSIARG